MAYTDEQKTEALAIYAEEGPTAVQHQLGIPKGTVTKWAKAQGVETVSHANTAAATAAARLKWEARRQDLADHFGDIVSAGLVRALHELEDGSANAGKNALVAAATAVDKALLLTGEPTERREVAERRNEMLAAARENSRGLRVVG